MIFSSDNLGLVLFSGIVVFVIWKGKKYIEMLWVCLISALTARFILVGLIRYLYYHPRPFIVLQNVNLLIPHDSESSFPSGHASFYFALAMGVYLYNKKAGYACLAIAGLIGFARIFVGVHWPLDILAGAVLGIVTALIIEFVKKRTLRRASL